MYVSSFQEAITVYSTHNDKPPCFHMQGVHAVIIEELYINARTVNIDVINNHVTKHLTLYMYMVGQPFYY